MEKPVLTPEEFVAEINRRLPTHVCYVDGLHVFLTPIGAAPEHVTGVDWAPRDELNGVVAVSAVHAQVASEFAVSKDLSRAQDS